MPSWRTRFLRYDEAVHDACQPNPPRQRVSSSDRPLRCDLFILDRIVAASSFPALLTSLPQARSTAKRAARQLRLVPTLHQPQPAFLFLLHSPPPRLMVGLSDCYMLLTARASGTIHTRHACLVMVCSECVNARRAPSYSRPSLVYCLPAIDLV